MDNAEPEARQARRYGKGSLKIDTIERNLVLTSAEPPMKPQIITPLQGRTIRALLFDLGNTLWTYAPPPHWETLEQEANREIASILRYEFAFVNETEAELLGLSQEFRTALSPIIRAHMRKDAIHEPDIVQVVQETFAEFGWPSVTPSQAFTLFQHTQIPVEGSRVLFADAIETLIELQQRGFLLGVVTNRIWGGAPFLAGMDRMGLFKFFAPENIAISADLRIRKPHATIFQYTLQALNVQPEEAIMVGDSLRADIIGANRLNIYAVWKTSPYSIEAFQVAEPQKELNAETLLTYNQDRIQKRYNGLYEKPQPDLIIEHLQDLLTFLPKAGQQ
jgi:FMN phosphatase YigB (HAD superfamily)